MAKNLIPAVFVLLLVSLPSFICLAELQPDELVGRASAEAEKISGLNFLNNVPTKLIKTRSKLVNLLRKFHEREYPEDKFTIFQEITDKLGFYIDVTESEEELIEQYARGIAGIYDDEDKNIYVVMRETREAIRIELAIRGCKIFDYPELSDEEEELIVLAILVHEMTHALQDQHYDLKNLKDKYKHNSDATYAIMALVEGMAEFVEDEFWDNEFGGRRRRDYVDDQYNLYTLLDEIRLKESKGVDILSVANKDICGRLNSHKNLLGFFKYVYGLALVEKAGMKYGWNDVKTLFNRYPLSSEQVIHPEKYFDEDSIDLPTFIGYPDFYEVLSEDFIFYDSDSLGEFQMYLLVKDLALSPQDAIKTTEGWDGDRYYAFRDPDDHEIMFAWITVWDSPADAKDFFKFYRSMAKSKSLTTKTVGHKGNLYYLKSAMNSISVEIKDNKVAIVEGLDDMDLQDKLRQLVLDAETFEATYDHSETLPDWLSTEESEEDTDDDTEGTE
ncbi:MAG: hypothetical protein AB1546_09700 [bacterium]